VPPGTSEEIKRSAMADRLAVRIHDRTQLRAVVGRRGVEGLRRSGGGYRGKDREEHDEDHRGTETS
jgi:hypothetical protein